jgi:crotonobetainyl-CoA:carnitine CoA-transferase CaiB-like acyl-CoA transferase
MALRAGSSVVDIMGGTFAAVAILAALRERETSGKGSASPAPCSKAPPTSSRSTWRSTRSGRAPPPMSVKRPAWGVDIFAPRAAAGCSSSHRHAVGHFLPRI